jgi:hypothetical protein
MWWLHFSKWSTSHSSVAIFQMCQRVGFTSHKSYLILGFVSNTMIFWTVQLLTEKLLNKGYDAPRLKSSKPKFKCHHHQLVGRYEIYISQMAIDFPPYMFFSFLYNRKDSCILDYTSNRVGVLSETWTVYPSRAPVFTPWYLMRSVLLSFLVFSGLCYFGLSSFCVSGLSIVDCLVFSNVYLHQLIMANNLFGMVVVDPLPDTFFGLDPLYPLFPVTI